MAGLFITFEGTEGGGKSTQIQLTADWLESLGHTVVTLREPGGTPIGEEIRHLLKHSEVNHNMTAEAELLLMNASRAQLVRELIRPALAAGKTVLCDRFFDSTTAYQGYGRQLDVNHVRAVIEFAVEDTIPNVTLWLRVPPEVSAARQNDRREKLEAASEIPAGERTAVPLRFDDAARDRFEEAGQSFFERVEKGFRAIAKAEPYRMKIVDAAKSIDEVQQQIRALLQPLL